MKKFLKWTGITVLVLLLALAAFAIYHIANTRGRLNKVYAITPPPVAIPTDSAALAHGAHLARTTCAPCHGNDLGGKLFFEDPALATIYTPNLTAGKGGVGATYTTEDWVRSIRHAVDPKGRPLFIMPGREFKEMGEHDLGSLIAYLHTVEPVDREKGPTEYRPMGELLVSLGALGDVINAETIDHTAPLRVPPPVGATAEYGSYLVDIHGCRTCHGPQLNGGKDPNPKAPFAPNLTRGGTAANWPTEQFLRTLRTGITPDERSLNPEFMLWPYYGQMHDEELQAIHSYLASLEPLPTTPH